MFCSNCGTKLSDTAKFCSSCGQKVDTVPASKNEAGNWIDQLPPKQKEEIFNIASQALLTPIREGVEHLERILGNGVVTDDDVKMAIDWYKSEEEKPTVDPQVNRIIKFGKAYVWANNIHVSFYNRWYSSQMDTRGKRKMLESDWYSYVDKGMRGLIRALGKTDNGIEIDDDTTNALLDDLKGLGQWLEDKVVEKLLLAVRLGNVKITEDSVAYVALKLGDERFGRISEVIARAVSKVK